MTGKGGMGEVYLGTDTRLSRSGAIKVSSFSLQLREARPIASVEPLPYVSGLLH
jgi:hypothetical protein